MSVAKIVKSRVFVALTVALLVMISTAALAQDTQSKVDLFAGYSWESPGRIGTPTTAGNNLVIPPGTALRSLQGASGWGASVTYNVKRYFGLTADFGGHYSDPANTGSILFGPKVMFHSEHITPFGEALFGFTRVAPQFVRPVNGLGIAVGGGMDMDITKHFAWRVIQADYVRRNFSSSNGLGTDHMSGARLQSGLVIRLGGGAPPVPPSATCSAQPTAIMAGEPINVTINATGFNPKHTVTYDWKSTGGTVAGKETTTRVDTAGLAPGNYTVTGTATDAKAKQNNVASCTANFTVNEPPKHPPVISCSAAPATVRSGDASTITAQASSPDNRPLTYTWTATGGRVTGTGATVTLDTAGAPAGPITVNGVVSDDRGLNANCSSSVNVEVPPPPPTASKLNEIVFPNEKKPWRVDNTAKAVLDDVALRLQREPEAKAVVVGQMDPSEEKLVKKLRIKNLAASRAVNTKEYLVTEKGIDPSRIEVRTGTAGGNRAEIWIVPAGATFNEAGTTPVDENAVKPNVEKKAAPAKKAVKKAAPKQ